jgi:uncharacterized protein
MDKIKKIALVIAGSLSLILGIIGIFLPLLPTTPLLLLAAACYIRSSKKLYTFLINNKYLGSYIKDYQEKGAVSKKTKIIALCFLWLSIGGSVLFVVTKLFIKFILISIAIGVTIHILRLKTVESLEDLKNNEE